MDCKFSHTSSGTYDATLLNFTTQLTSEVNLYYKKK